MNNFYKRFVKESFDEKGILKDFEINCSEDYNFAFDVIDAIADLNPNKTAIHWINELGEEHKFSFLELKERSNQVANMLIKHGVKKGDMVMSVLKRHYEFWFLAYGLMKIGAIIIPATNQLTEKDYIYRFESANVKFIVATAEGDVVKNIEHANETYLDIKEKFIVHGEKDGWVSFLDEMDKYPKDFARTQTKVTDPLLMYFSSGTTGYPKMVIHDHYYSVGHILTAKHWHNVDENSLHLTVSETGWGKCAWGKMFGQLTCGATVFIYDFEKFDPIKLLRVIEQCKITSFCAPPTMYRFFIKENLGDFDLSNLKYATIAGEALNAEVFYKFYEYTGLKLMEGFGQTETVLIILNLVGQEPKPGSMGKPSPLYDVDLVDENGKTVADGEVGEIVVRTHGKTQKSIFKNYYNNPEATKISWQGDIYHTGDTATRDSEGYFWYVGRTDDLIKASGYRIGPFEIESVLIEHPSVLECAVTGVTDAIRGNVVKATIVLAKGYVASDELAKELQQHVKKTTAPYKYPRIVEFVDELPKTISGKIRRVEIRENHNK